MKTKKSVEKKGTMKAIRSTRRTVPSAPEHTEDELKANMCGEGKTYAPLTPRGKANTMIYLKKIFILLFLFQSIDRLGIFGFLFLHKNSYEYYFSIMIFLF